MPPRKVASVLERAAAHDPSKGEQFGDKSCALSIKWERDLGANETFVRPNRLPLLLVALAHAPLLRLGRHRVFGEPVAGSFVHDMF
jgi:hypothetical protein